MKHTPAPWILSQAKEWPWTYYVDNADDAPVIAIKLHAYSTQDTQESANARAGNEATHANARLIAASPALLEALEGCEQYFIDMLVAVQAVGKVPTGGRTEKQLAAVRAAIKAAKGGA